MTDKIVESYSMIAAIDQTTEDNQSNACHPTLSNNSLFLTPSTEEDEFRFKEDIT